MRIIVITTPHFWQGEAQAINALFTAGLETLHLRKPDSSLEEVETLLSEIEPKYLCRIVVHDHFELAARYPLHGVHLNQRNPAPPPHHTGTVSCSCHSLDEVKQYKPTCDYVFLSPIFDSISKQGYAANFSPEQLCNAQREGVIDDKVIALGGIDKSRIPDVRSWGFGGAALLGDIWQQPDDRRATHLKKLSI